MAPPSSHQSPHGILHAHSAIVGFLQRFADAVIIATTLLVVNWIYNQPWHVDFTVAAGLAVLTYLAVAPVTGLYRSWRGRSLGEECGVALTTWIAVIPVLLLTAFLTKTTEHYSRVVVTAWFVVVPLSTVILRLTVRTALKYLRKNGRNMRRVAIAGATESGVKIANLLAASGEAGIEIVGIFDDRAATRLAQVELGQQQIVGRIDDLIEQTKQGSIDIAYLAFPLRAERRLREIIARLADTTATVYVVTDIFVFDLMQARWGDVEGMPVVSIFDTPFHGLGGWVKRAEDLVLSSVILLLIAIPMLVIAIAIKLTSRGPVFFKQSRYGLNGKPIRVLKFRSMTTMDDGPTVRQATKDDARVTPLGRFLRRTSLDELPQFINVLMGDMSVVGPRPHAVAHNELYRGKIRGYMLRHKVKPGITGWAQVNGWRGETEVVEKMEQRIEHDLYYIDNWSLFWDLKIVFLTIFGRNSRKQAY